MTEADLRRRWQERFEKDGRGVLWRIPDSPPTLGPDGLRSSGTRPCDLVGVIASPDEDRGKALACEIKLQKGGRSFSVDRHFRGRRHQLAELAKFERAGGQALIVVGWIPVEKRRAVVFEVPASEIGALDHASFLSEGWQRWQK